MCFHYALTTKAKSAKARYPQIDADINIVHANGFTHPKMPVILNCSQDSLSFLEWGLIPFWVEGASSALALRKNTLNARSETVFDKPSFKSSILNKRCLVLAEGYYEYHHFNGKNFPYYINLKSKELFSFAGIWSTWFNAAENKNVNSFSILTTTANDLIAKVHNKPKASEDARMPLILTKENEMNWLKQDLSIEDLNSFFKPFDEMLMQVKLIGKIGEMDKQTSLF